MTIMQWIRNCWARWQVRRLVTEQPALAAQVKQLQDAGWSATAVRCFARGNLAIEVTTQIGSPTYLQMLAASGLTAHQQLALIIDRQLGAQIDTNGFLQLTNPQFQLWPGLSPKSEFYPIFRQLVVDAYSTPLGLSQDGFGRKVHLFRAYLDRQNINFIRHYPAGPAATDYQRLLQYCQDNDLQLDYQTGANFHNRYHGTFEVPSNMKVQLMRDSDQERDNPARMIEFIIDILSGSFVSQWNVYRLDDQGRIDADPAHYSVAEMYQIANTESFNYGLPKGVYRVPRAYRGTHRTLDINQPANSQIRRAAKDYWRYPHDYNHGGDFAELVKDGGDADVKSWRAIPADQRQQLYQAFVTDMQKHHRQNHGINAYLKQHRQ